MPEENSDTHPGTVSKWENLGIEVWTPRQVMDQVALIQAVMQAVMKEGEHFGTIPGTDKPTLYKAGAEKMCLTFRMDPEYESTETYEGQHLTIKSRCSLYQISNGKRLGSGEGSCSTKETKYAYRHAARKCPACGKEAIIKGKEEYGGGWLCWKKRDGCGAKFGKGDKAIESQETGRVPNEDLPDTYNTILKMANKRSLVAAVLNVTGASDIFTQDMEDYVGLDEAAGVDAKDVTPPKAAAPPPPAHPVKPESTPTPAPPPPAPAGNGVPADWPVMRAIALISQIGRGRFSPQTCREWFGDGVANKTALEALAKDKPEEYLAGCLRLTKALAAVAL